MKRIKQLILVFVCILLLSGCVKEHTKMTINKDKSMDFEIEMIVNEGYLEQAETNYSSMLNENAAKLEKKGYTVTPKHEDGYSGYVITKKYKSIDNLLNKNGENVSLDSIIKEGNDLSNLFTVEKGFLKSVYTAKFTLNIDEDYVNTINNIMDDETDNDNETTIGNEDSTLIINDDNMIPTTEAVANEETADGIESLNGLIKDMEFTYVVNLPYKAGTNNASKVSQDGKTLTWNIVSNSKASIEYTFPIYNLTSIIILGAGGLVLLIVLIVIISIISKRKSSNKETLIHTDYDSSIVGQIDEATAVQDEIPQGPTNHEFSVPGEPQVDVTQESAVQTPTMSAPDVPQPQITPQETLTPVSNVTQGPQVDAPNMVSLSDVNQNNINQ